MNVILLTILLTVLGVCLVTLITWLSITSFKLMKFKKRAEDSFKHLERWIDDNQNTISKELEVRDLENQKKNDDIYMNINNHINEVYRNMDSRVANLNNDNASLNSKIDSRCDKLQEQLKHKSSTTPTGMGDKTWEV